MGIHLRYSTCNSFRYNPGRFFLSSGFPFSFQRRTLHFIPNVELLHPLAMPTLHVLVARLHDASFMPTGSWKPLCPACMSVPHFRIWFISRFFFSFTRQLFPLLLVDTGFGVNAQ